MDANQVFKLDIETLLRTVSLLETQLAEQSRQTTVPFWATDLISRITSLELSNENLERQVLDLSTVNRGLQETIQEYQIQRITQPNNNISATTSSSSLLLLSPQHRSRDDFSSLSRGYDPKIAEKIRYDYENYVQNVRNTMELKLTSLHVEIERAYKLIQSRPTVTDFQHVSYQMQALENKVYDNINEMSSTLKTNIQDNISVEMSNLVTQLKNNETLTDQNFQLVFEKFDNQVKDIDDVRVNMKEFTEFVRTNLESINEKSLAFNHHVENNNDMVTKDLNEIRDLVKEFYNNQQSATESYVDIKATMSRRLMSLEETIKEQETFNKETFLLHEGKINRLNEDISNLDHDIRQVDVKYEHETKTLTEKILSHDESIRNLEYIQKTISDSIDSIRVSNTITSNKLLALMKQIEYSETKWEDTNSNITKLGIIQDSKFKVLDILQTQLESAKSETTSLKENLKGIINTYTELNKQLEQSQISNRKLEDDLQKLSLVWEETSSLRQLYKNTDDRLNNQHFQMTKLSDTIHENKVTMAYLCDVAMDKAKVVQSEMMEFKDMMNENWNSANQNMNNIVKSITAKVDEMGITIHSINTNPHEFFGQVNPIHSYLTPSIPSLQISSYNPNVSTNSNSNGNSNANYISYTPKLYQTLPSVQALPTLKSPRQGGGGGLLSAPLSPKQSLTLTPRQIVSTNSLSNSTTSNNLSNSQLLNQSTNLTILSSSPPKPSSSSRPSSGKLSTFVNSVPVNTTGSPKVRTRPVSPQSNRSSLSPKNRTISPQNKQHNSMENSNSQNNLSSSQSLFPVPRPNSSPVITQLSNSASSVVPNLVPNSLPNSVPNQITNQNSDLPLPHTNSYGTLVRSVSGAVSYPQISLLPVISSSPKAQRNSPKRKSSYTSSNHSVINMNNITMRDDLSDTQHDYRTNNTKPNITSTVNLNNNNNSSNNNNNNNRHHHNEENQSIKYIDELSDTNQLIDLCQKYEDSSVQCSTVLEFSDAMCDSVTTISKRQAIVISSDVDEEVVRKTIHSDSNDQNTIIESNVSTLRQNKLIKLLDEVKDVVVKRYPHPGVVRLDAREKFFKKLKLAIEMWLSKYDQVFVIGNSRLGRVKIPTCIACDRPLLKKERKSEEFLQSSFSSSSSFYQGSVNDRLDQAESSLVIGSSAMNIHNRKDINISRSIDHIRTMSISSRKDSRPSTSGSIMSDDINAPRGGFRVSRVTSNS